MFCWKFNVANSGELVFFDSSSNMEEYKLRVFVMVTHSPVGALPLGIIITSDETCTTLMQAFELFRECLPLSVLVIVEKILVH